MLWWLFPAVIVAVVLLALQLGRPRVAAPISDTAPSDSRNAGSARWAEDQADLGRDGPRQAYLGTDARRQYVGSPLDEAAQPEIGEGVGAFVDPGELQVDKWYLIEFVVGPDESAIAHETEGQELTNATNINIAPIMRVTLLQDPNFKTKSRSPKVQETGLDYTASWQWAVMPLSAGRHRLCARVEVLRRAATGELSAADSYTRRVEIVVTASAWKSSLASLEKTATLGDRLEKLFGSWQKVLVALTALIGAAVALWAAIRSL